MEIDSNFSTNNNKGKVYTMSKKELNDITNQYSQNPSTRKIERVACYVRVSHQEQKLHGLSLDAQKMKLTEYAKKNHMKIVGWYVDEGVSGRKLIRNRPELQRMIQDAEKGNFDRVLFIKLDRFFRSVAEYHECMKRIAPVLWTTTEEDYDLTTANGRMLVNMKLTIAEMEADQTGERINIVNEYKITTGQPLTGAMPFGFKITIDEETKRKKIIRDPEQEEIMKDLLDFFFTHQSKKGAVVYLQAKHHIHMPYNSLTRLLKNTMLCGEYRENKQYCESYITREEFDKLQEIMKRNVKENRSENIDYLFTGLIKCPDCGRRLAGSKAYCNKSYGQYLYKTYRCNHNGNNNACIFKKRVNEKALEKLMLENIEKYFEEAKIRTASVSESDSLKIPKYNIDDINEQIDRLNYSWQTGKIRKVETYEEQYAELLKKLELAESEQTEIIQKDFSHIEEVLKEGWKEIYNALDDAHKRAFWRSFVSSIEINWTTKTKELDKVNFF